MDRDISQDNMVWLKEKVPLNGWKVWERKKETLGDSCITILESISNRKSNDGIGYK